MKPLDMADKYDPLSYQDEEPTVKMQVPTFLPRIEVSEEGEDDYFDLQGQRDTIPCDPPYEEKRYPGVGLLLCLATGLAFWGTLAYFIFR